MAPPGVVFRFAVGCMLVMMMNLVLVSADGVERLGRPLDAGEGRVLTQSNITFLLEDLSLTDGVLFAISAFFLSRDAMRVQVWRPQSIIDRKYKMLWDARVSAPAPGIFTVYFKDIEGVECPFVQQGDRIGLYGETGAMPIAYTFMSQGSPSTLRHPLGVKQPRVRRGETVRFDALRYPYRYSVNAFVHTDLNAYTYTGQEGVMCPNISTQGAIPNKVAPPTVLPPSEKGSNSGGVGHTGPSGPSGPPGPQGPPGFVYPIPGQTFVHRNVSYGSSRNCIGGSGDKSSCSCVSDGTLLHNHIILAIFVWLTALSVLNGCYLCVMCCRSIRKAATPKAPPPVQTNDQNMWVEKIRETVREFNGNAAAGNMTTGLGPGGAEGKLSKLDYDVPLPEDY